LSSVGSCAPAHFAGLFLASGALLNRYGLWLGVIFDFKLIVIAPAVKYAKLMIAIAAEAAPTGSDISVVCRSGFSRDNLSLFNHRSNR
jgi:hypothetical protein